MCPNPHQDASPNNAAGDDPHGIAQVHKRLSLAVVTYTSAFFKRISLVGSAICRPDSATTKERTLTTLRAKAETRLIRCKMLCTVRASRTCIPVHGRQAWTCVQRSTIHISATWSPGYESYSQQPLTHSSRQGSSRTCRVEEHPSEA